MPAVLVYRDRLLAPPEGFVPRQYQAFTALEPVYLGCRRDSAFDRLDHPAAILGELAGTHSAQVPLFKQFGLVPAALLRWARAQDVRVVHAQFGRGGALALPLARALDVPLVVTFHGGDASKDKHFRRSLIPTVFQRRWQRLQRNASRFLCVSEFVRRRLLERGVREELLAVHHLGVELPVAAPDPAAPSRQLLAVGRFVAKKGFGDAIETLRAARAAGSDLELVLVGDGPLRAELEARAKDLPVRFPGWLAPDQVAEAMASALALLVPSRKAAGGDSEGLPTVVLEAQARGLPVLATRHAGIPEAVRDGVTGLLVEEGDVPGMAAAINRLASEDGLRLRLRQAALASVREDFDAVRQSRRLERRLLALL
ncbi:glycosyltransferase [Geminicoccus roseus]|uniref:glycosyltransferase n=1 Tax=Geminicoccus roseus TaxID=404900 RepID=UPI000412DAE8|nr:glycosyltransferase [Geminicoccus roseus]